MRHPLLKKLDNDETALNWAFFRASFGFCFFVAVLLSSFLIHITEAEASAFHRLFLIYGIPGIAYALASVVGEKLTKLGLSLVSLGFFLALTSASLMPFPKLEHPNISHSEALLLSGLLIFIYVAINTLLSLSTLHAFVSLNTHSSSKKSNLVLIGMPGAGKSTLGRMLSERSDWPFIDTDQLIEETTGKSLQDIVETEGHETLRAIEAQCLKRLNCDQSIISTGGSAVYSQSAMEHLRNIGEAVYLELPLEVIKVRIGDYSARGLAKPKNQSLEALYQERHPMYQRYAHHRLKCVDKDPKALCDLLEGIKKNMHNGATANRG